MLFTVITIILDAAKRLTSQQRAQIQITSHQQQVYIKIILGDAWSSVRGQKVVNARLGFAQSVIHREFFNTVFDLFACFCTVNYEPSIKTYIRAGYTNVTKSMTFITMQLACFLTFYNMFYVDNKKICFF